MHVRFGVKLMSTKDPLVLHDQFEVYRDYFDDGFVWLALRKTEFEATPSEIRIKLPVAQWEMLRRAPGEEFEMLGITDDQIAAHVQSAVDERLRDCESDLTTAARFSALFGVLVFGSIQDPRERQIAKGVAHYTARRARQRRIAEQIAELEQQTTFTISNTPFINALRLQGDDESEREADELKEIAVRVLGSSESVVRWMTTQALALDGARPGDLL